MQQTILVTGSRAWQDPKVLGRALVGQVRRYPGPSFLVVGDADGADALALVTWLNRSNPHRGRYRKIEADWVNMGAAAGPYRNQQLVDYAAAQPGEKICLSFLVPSLPCRGTRNCMSKARYAGIPVKEHVQP